MMETDRISLLVNEGEGLTIEFKEHFTSRIAEEMVAFANTRGGTVILGVRDDRSVVGEKLTGALKAQILSLARNCTPPIDVSITQAGDMVAVAVDEGRDKPYSCSAGYFRRLDAVTQKMSTNELRILFRTTEMVRFEQQICRSCSVSDLSSTKIRTFCKTAGISMKGITPEAVLNGLELVSGAGITNAAVLLFGKYPAKSIHQCSMLLLAFKGTSNVDIYDRMDVKGDLFAQCITGMEFIKKHINRRSIIEGTYRRDVYEVPEQVIREAIANAIVHRDYSMEGTDVTVSVFDDRLEIKNPGGLPPGVSEKTLGSISIRRNPLISEMFNRIDIIEKAGTGFVRMRNALLQEGFPEPEVKSESFFFITFKRVYNLELLNREPIEYKEKPTQKTTEKTTEKILSMLIEYPAISMKELCGKLDISYHTVDWNIRKLRKTGKIRRIGPDKGGHWEVTAGKYKNV